MVAHLGQPSVSQRLAEVLAQARERCIATATCGHRFVLARADEEQRRFGCVHGERVELGTELGNAVVAQHGILEVGQREDEHRDRGLGRVQQVKHAQEDVLPAAVLDVQH